MTFIKKINLVLNQEIANYRFENNNNNLFNVLIGNEKNEDIPLTIKFNKKHMSYSCNYLDYDKIVFLLNNKMKPSNEDINSLLLLNNKYSIKILELFGNYGINTNTLTTVKLQNTLDLTKSQLKELKSKFMRKSNYIKINKNPTIEILEKLFLFDTLENIKKYIELHKIKINLTCCENSILNSNIDVMTYVLSETNYIPSIKCINKIDDFSKRLFMLEKYYSNLLESDEYKNQQITQPNFNKTDDIKISLKYQYNEPLIKKENMKYETHEIEEYFDADGESESDSDDDDY